MTIITRAQWGAADPRGGGNPLGNPSGITQHWEGPSMGVWDHTLCAGKVRGIQRFHQVSRGWSDIAYNMIVCPHGDAYVGRGADRGNAANGDSSNATRYSVCAMTGEGDPTTVALKRGILDAHAWLRKESGRALPALDCHSDHVPTSCPGPVLRAWIKDGAPLDGPPAPNPPASSVPNLPKPKPRPTPSKGLNVKLIDLRDVSPYVTGPGVKPLQRLLGVPADGYGGPGTRTALGAAQRRCGLPVDYIFGPNTAEALLSGK